MIGGVQSDWRKPMLPDDRPACMRRCALLTVGIVLASALAVMPINTALACTCVARTDDEAMAAADVAFIGVVMEIHDARQGMPVISSMDPIEYTIVIEEPLKGDVVAGQEVTVFSARLDASCGEVMAAGERWRLLARRDGAGFTTGSCSGNALQASRVTFPERPSGGDLSINPLLMILGAGAVGLVALLAAVLLLRWLGRPAI